jgi:predicted GNAT family N-acyltransferase
VLEGFEAGQAMLDCRTGTWPQLGRDAVALRQAVFEVEQGVQHSMAHDVDDEAALHVVAYNRFGLAIGAGRLLQGEAGRARIGRLAVIVTLRGSGVGAALVRALIAGARACGEREVVVSAPSDARRFYERLGFDMQEPALDVAGVPHQEMLLAL